MMKYVLLCFFCLTVTACVTAPVPDASPASREKVTAFLADKSQIQIERLLGEPTVSRTESPYQLWAYQTNNCSTLIYFDDSGRSQYVDVRGPCTHTVASR